MVVLKCTPKIEALSDQLTVSVQYVTDAVQSFDAAALAVLSTKSVDLANTVSALPFIS
ncbi:hypothetical protein [Oceanicaulis sp.]|jgi:hypothetical protein|uniref:hypothetical protein n=1 Tax=Oceanicaulis sp. TaxID=1924941 RepID=UPI003F705158